MEIKKRKFNLVQLASEAFYTCTFFGFDKTFQNSIEFPNRFLSIVQTSTALDNANRIFRDYFSSSEYEDTTQKKIHIIDLDQENYDNAVIKLSKTKVFKPISSVSRNHELTKEIAKGDLICLNAIELDNDVKHAFDEALQPQDFFKFSEVRTEYRISVSIVKNRKVVKRIKCNLGHFTLIKTSKAFDYQVVESSEKKADRPTLYNPVYYINGTDVLVKFNDTNKYYRELVEMMRV